MRQPSGVRRVTRHAARLGRDRWSGSLVGSGLRRSRQLDLDTHALALLAQQVLTTAPLVVAMSYVLQGASGHPLGHSLAKLFGLRGESAAAVEGLFARTSSSISTAALVFSLVAAMALTTSVGAVQQRAFELIWALGRVSGVRSYLRQLIWAVGFAAYCAGLAVVIRGGRLLGHLYGANVLTSNVFAGVLTTAFFWWSQRWLLGNRVAWRALLPGAATVGIGTTVLMQLSRQIVPGQITWQVHAYGLIGGVFVLSAWLMVLSGVIFAGILFGAVFVQRRAVAASGPEPVRPGAARRR